MERLEPSSKHHDCTAPAAEIAVREDAQRSLRNVVFHFGEEVEIGSHDLRDIVCRALNRAPDVAANWLDEHIDQHDPHSAV